MSKRRSVHTARRARNSNVSPKSGVTAGGLAQGAMTQIARGRIETYAAGAMNRTAGWGMAALGREPVGGVRYGGACYTGSAADEAQVAGLAWGYGGVLGWHTGFQVPLLHAPRPC